MPSDSSMIPGFTDGKAHLMVRWLLIAAFSAMIVTSNNLLVTPVLAYGLVLASIISNVLLHWLPQSTASRSEIHFGLGIIDLLTITLALVISGQTDGSFYLMYFLVIAIASLSRHGTGTLLLIGLIVLFSYAVVAAHAGNFLAPSHSPAAHLTVALMGLRCAHLVRRLRSEQADKRAAEDSFQRSQSQVKIQRVLTELNQDIATLDTRGLMRKLTDAVREFLAVDVSDARLLDGTTIEMLALSGPKGSLENGNLGSRSKRFEKMIETRQPICVSDVAKESAVLKSGATRYPGIRGYLAVPFLSRTGEVIGSLRALTYEPRDFTAGEVELLQQAANGAAILLENARLIADLKVSNAELLRASREQRSLQSLLADIFLLEVDPLLQKLTHEALALLEAEVVWTRVLDEQGAMQTGVIAGPQEVVRWIRTNAEDTLTKLGHWMIEHKKPLAVKDLSSDLRQRKRDAAQAANGRGLLGAPLLSREQQPLGLIFVITGRPREFTQHDINLVEQFANGAAIAIENARLLRDLREKTQQLQSTNLRLQQLLEEQSALREIITQINLLDSDQLLEQLAEHALKLLRVDHVQVRLVKDAVLRTVALAGVGAEQFRQHALASGKGRSTWIMQHREPLVIRNIGQDMFFGPGNLMNEMGVKAYLGVPLLSREHRSLGVLIVTSLQERSFNNHEIALAEQLAAGAAVAIENAALFEEVQAASKKIEEAFRTKTAFMNTMAHELRTPLSIILGTHELFAQGVYGELTEDQREAWERVRRNAQALLGLINEILDLVRLESKKVALQLDTILVTQLLTELISALGPLAVKKGIDLNFEVGGGEIVMRSDPSKLRMVLQNLIANAIKYTDKGRVEVRADLLDPQGANGRIGFSVADTGIGLAEGDLQHIFEAFYMAEGVDRQKYPGTGLGLCIVQRLAELLAGRVEVTSQLGQGSIFTVTLPLHHPDEETMKKD